LTATSSSEEEIEHVLGSVNPEISTILIQEIEGFSFVQQAVINNFIKNLPKKPSTRVIVTAKQPPREWEKGGKTIGGLAERLKAFAAVSVPPLAQPTEDIPLLVRHFIKIACDTIGAGLKPIDGNAVDFLVRREWNENIRELRWVVEKAVFTSIDREVIELPHNLVDEFSQLEGLVVNIKEKRPFAFDKSLANLERTLIESALVSVGYNQSKAAAVLNLSEANLRYRLKKFRIRTSREIQ
jgi:Nif-specific regulatory protein